MLKRADHIGFNVTNMDACIPFWTEIVGLIKYADFFMDGEFLNTVQGKTEMNYRIVKFKTPDGFIIELLQDFGHAVEPQKDNSLQNAGIRHFALEVSDVDAFFTKVTSAGYRTISAPATSDDGCMRLFFVRDPEQNLIEFMQFM